MKDKVIVITGPTASGKSGLGIKLAKKINGEIISADSMQIYKKLDVGTAKVTPKEADGVPHHLIDIVDIDQKFSVSEYKDMCYAKIDEILSRGKVPIIVGGTGLYINAVVNNMTFEKVNLEKEKEADEKLKEIIENKTDEEIYEVLYNLDKESAIKIGKGNVKRLTRAIKLNILGIKKSDIDNRQDLWITNNSKYNFLTFFIDMPRDLLYDRINKRVDIMNDLGIMEEVKFVYRYKDSSITAVQAIGYKEFFPYIEGEKSLDECLDLLKQKTRNYAKRQITWFKKLVNKKNIDGTKTYEEIISSILKEYYEK